MGFIKKIRASIASWKKPKSVRSDYIIVNGSPILRIDYIFDIRNRIARDQMNDRAYIEACNFKNGTISFNIMGASNDR